MSLAKTASQRQTDLTKRRKQAGQVLVRVWVWPENATKVQAMAAPWPVTPAAEAARVKRLAKGK